MRKFLYLSLPILIFFCFCSISAGETKYPPKVVNEGSQSNDSTDSETTDKGTDASDLAKQLQYLQYNAWLKEKQLTKPQLNTNPCIMLPLAGCREQGDYVVQVEDEKGWWRWPWL